MLIEDFFRGHFGFHRGKSVSLGLESGDDVSDDAALNSIGFDLSFSVKE